MYRVSIIKVEPFSSSLQFFAGKEAQLEALFVLRSGQNVSRLAELDAQTKCYPPFSQVSLFCSWLGKSLLSMRTY